MSSTATPSTPEPKRRDSQPPPRRSAISELRPMALFRSKCNRGFFSPLFLSGPWGFGFPLVPRKRPNQNPPTAAAAAEQIKPIVGGLSPEEVQTRLKENEAASRNAAATLHSDPPPTTDAQFKAIFRNADQLSTDSENAPQNPARDPLAEDERKREYGSGALLPILRIVSLRSPHGSFYSPSARRRNPSAQ